MLPRNGTSWGKEETKGILMKALVVFGTRPEVIKMAPLVHALENSFFSPLVCATAQHRQMLDQACRFFKLKPDFDLNIMKQNQDLFSVTSEVLNKMGQILQEHQPQVVLVQGGYQYEFCCWFSCIL